MFAFVLTLAFLLLLVTFRSLVIPIKAIVLNLLSVAAAYGVLVWVFQDGHLENVLGFKSNGGVTSWLPMFLFVILFGLSMDYHVFILSRIREAVDRGMRTEDAVSHGIRATAGTVTSAAIVMVAVFAIFATLSSIDFKEMGVGLVGRDPHRRDDRPGGAAAGHDEAPRQVELVPAAEARVAAEDRPRAAPRGREGLAPVRPLPQSSSPAAPWPAGLAALPLNSSQAALLHPLHGPPRRTSSSSCSSASSSARSHGSPCPAPTRWASA